MTKVRILSGNQAGEVQDLPQIEAENAVATGYAELVVEPEKKTRSELRKEREEAAEAVEAQEKADRAEAKADRAEAKAAAEQAAKDKRRR